MRRWAWLAWILVGFGCGDGGMETDGPCSDGDDDGVCDADDVCPAYHDDVDGDGDGTPDGCDPCPLDNPDDSDGDGSCDSADICPTAADPVDTDGDGICDGADACPTLADPDDTDGDGVCDSNDACPGFDDAADIDSDGAPDDCDICPLDATDDSDGDSVCDGVDLCDGYDDALDADLDGEADGCDACPLDAPPDDADGDGVCDSDDVCPMGDDTIDLNGNGFPDACDGGFFQGPTIIQYVETGCNGTPFITLYAETQGWTSSATINMSDTANQPPWDEEHSMTSIDFDPFGRWDILERVLSEGPAPGYTPDVSSLFTCRDHIDDVVMSYALTVYDADGNFADCVTWGDDPVGMELELYCTYNGCTEDLSLCAPI